MKNNAKIYWRDRLQGRFYNKEHTLSRVDRCFSIVFFSILCLLEIVKMFIIIEKL